MKKGITPVRYKVEMTAFALVRGSASVDAASPEEAAARAKEEPGNVLWKYDGVQDETIEAQHVEAA